LGKTNGGTSDLDDGRSLTVDGSGNVYIAGEFSDIADLDPGTGVFNLSSPGNIDIFVCKLDPNGNFIWARQIGGSSGDDISSIVLDASGNVHIAGYFRGTADFDPGAEVFNLVSAPLNRDDIFVCKLDANGNFVWAKQMGGAENDRSSSMALDASGNVLTTGSFRATADFDPGLGTFNLTAAVGLTDIFVSKLDALGNFVWAKAMTGTGVNEGRSIATDASGNVFTTGQFENSPTDFDPGTGVFNLTPTSEDVFVSKLDASGNFVWAKQLGGASADVAYSIIVDALGNVYTTGEFAATADFDPGAGTFNLTSSGSQDAFVSKLDASGNFVWAIRMGGPSFAYGFSIAVDASYNLIVNGGFGGTVDFDPNAGTSNLTSITPNDLFIIKLSQPPTITSFAPASGPVGTTVTITGTNFSTTPANNTVQFNGTAAVVTTSTATSITTTVPVGATTGKISVTVAGNTATSTIDFTVTIAPTVAPGLEWAVAVGNNTLDTNVLSMTTDASGNVYIAGQFDGTVDFDPRSGVFNLTSAGNGDGYVSKLSSSGDLIWAFQLGGPGNDEVDQIEVDGAGNIYVAGTDFSKYDTNGNLLWVLPLAVNENDIELDASGNVYIVGTFSGTVDFDPGTPVFNLTASGTGDFFVMSITAAGNFVWARRIGGTGSEVARSLALDAGGNLCVTGDFFSPTVDFDPGAGTANLSLTGTSDIFILKLDNAGNYVWARRIGGTGGEGAERIATDAASNVLITGSFNGTLDFDPGAAVVNLTSVGGGDVFVLKINSAGNYVWAKSVGGINSDDGRSISTDAAGDVYYTGEYRTTTDFDPGPGVFNISAGGGKQVFVSKLSASGNFLWALGSQANTGGPWAFNPEISLTSAGNIIIAGDLEDGTVDFDPGACVAELTAASGSLITFVLKLSLTATCLPVISSFTPTSGPAGTTVVITGTNFDPTPANNTVQFNGTTAVVTASTATSITVTVPAGATTGPITVTVGGNTATSSTNFTVTASPVITITTQPSPSSVCIGTTSTFTTAATGTTNLIYQWQFSSTLAGTYSDIANGSGYTNVATATLSVNTTGNFGAGFYRCQVNGDFAATVFTNAAELTINAIPTAPTVTGASNCGAGSVVLTASGGSAGQYRWYDTSTGGTAITAQTNATFTTPSLTDTRDFYVSINNGSCESARTPVTATINTVPSKPIILSSTALVGNALTICSTSTLTLSAPNGFDSYAWSNGETTQQITVATTENYSVTVTSLGCTSPTSDVVSITVVPAPCTNQPPLMNFELVVITVGGTVSVDLLDLISDADGNLVASSLSIVEQPSSGAQAVIDNGALTIDYSSVPFSGNDGVRIRVCDTFGACSEQDLLIDVIGEINVFNALSPGSDGKNDVFYLENIELLPSTIDNKVTIFNRWGDVVFDVENYNNDDKVFRGLSNDGKELPTGVYFYKIVFVGGEKSVDGFISLRR
jgi:gliding motility-associated-like protein